MREIIELIRKHQKTRRILRCELPYFYPCSQSRQIANGEFLNNYI